MNAIPLVDLRAQHDALERELTAAVAAVMGRCDFILGDSVAMFEQEFTAFVGTRHAVGVASGLDALRLSLQVAGVGRGDEVILPANTFIATALAVSAAGARPVPVDVDAATFNLDPARIDAAITPRTKAIIPVHLYGQPCEMDEIVDIARRRGLVLIEDACQSHGATYKTRVTGAFGVTGCFSFYPAKNLGACGDGGLIVTNEASLADRLRAVRHYGQVRRYVHDEQGTNSRLDSLQAAILRVKLRHLSSWNALRAKHAERYSQRLAGLAAVIVPVVEANRSHVFHLYVVRVARRGELQHWLSQQGIETGIHYPTPIHLHGAYADLGYQRGQFPVAERLADEVLSLPMYPELTEAQIDFVCDAVRAFY
jgi:dTDP-4-amino-4,6-dideoxygalactose transaminase